MSEHLSDLHMSYAGKFWEAGDNVLKFIVALAFGVYAVLAVEADVRELLREADNFLILLFLAIFGNSGLAFLLFRYYNSESIILQTFKDVDILMRMSTRAFRARIILLSINLLIYIFMITYIHMK